MNVKQIAYLYKFALAVIAVLSVLSFAVVQHMIADGGSVATLINMSGKQRMLTQRAGVLSLRLTGESQLSADTVAEIKEELRQTVTEMSNAHEILTRRELGQLYPPLSSAMNDIYFGDALMLDLRMKDHLATLRRIYQGEIQDIRTIESIIRSVETDLLPALDQVVQQYERESIQAIDRLRLFQETILVITLVVLLLEGRFIFRPILSSITKHTHDLIEASQVKSDFLANMSHELRTPLNGILGLCDVMLDGKLNADQRQNIRIIKQSGESLRALLNDILDISKIEAGGIEIETVDFSLADAVQQVVQPLSTLSEKKGVALNVVGLEECPHYLCADQAKIQQILRNLVSNALKFTERGSVTIDLSHDAKSEVLSIRVIDTGIGIPEEKLGTIFEKFTQADNSTRRRYGGTGLGLCITKQLVELLGGEIGVQSIVGLGTTFNMSLPCTSGVKPQTASASHIDLEADFSSLSLRVLAVDDHPVNLLLLKKMLLKVGIAKPDIAQNGLEALAMCKDNEYDMILMDCQMPEMDGYTATREIRKHEAVSERHTIIIAMTANAMVGDREKCLKAGMDDYLSKPITKDRFLHTVSPYLLHYKRSPKDILSNTADGYVKNETVPIDMDHLHQFTDGNKEDEQEFFSLFLEQTSDVMTTLRSALDSGDCEEWRGAAHKLKGSSANLGAFALSKACENAQCAWTDGLDVKQSLFASIQKELGRIEAFMQVRS